MLRLKSVVTGGEYGVGKLSKAFELIAVCILAVTEQAIQCSNK